MEWAGQDYALQINILNRWIESNPSAAAEWARLHGQRGSANQLFLMSLGGLVAVDPSAAMQEVQKLSSPGERRMAFQATLGGLEKKGKEDVRKWLDALPSSDLRIEAVTTLVAGKGPSFCPDRIYWLEIYPEASKQANLLGSWGFWFQQDEKAALEHFATATPDSMKGAALEGMTTFCARSGDPARGLELMDANSQQVTPAAISAWVKATGKRDPVLALSQASRIQDPAENESVVTKILNRWIQSDHDAAESWLDKNAVPDSVREAIGKPWSPRRSDPGRTINRDR